jgi:hypothetical protein
MKEYKFLKAFSIWCLLLPVSGCVSVETYQKMYVNDRDMQLEFPLVQTFEIDFQSFREGASGANGGKTGGGCGCN